MPYLAIENFRGGLDTRRFLLTSQAGTLQTLQNCHITRGGEIETRKAFSSYAAATANTYGLEATSDGLLKFGSVSPPSMPAGITYQRLQHPGASAMTSVVHSTVYNGNAFVIAEFADGSRQCFYDGSLVTDFSDGVVRADMVDNAGIASHLKDLIDADADFSATVASNVVTVTGPVGIDYTMTAAVTGSVTATIATTGGSIVAVTEQMSAGSVELTGGTSGDISSVTVNGVTITSGAVTYANSLNYTAQLLADNINNYTSSPDYTATRSGAKVIIRPLAGVSPITYAVVSTFTGTLTTTDKNMNSEVGGYAAVAGRGEIGTITIGGTFTPGNKVTITITYTSGGSPVTKTFGAGRVAGLLPSYALTHGSKVYLIAGSQLYFSATDEPTQWNAGDTGSGVISMQSHYGGNDDLIGLAVYQNNLAVFARRSIQIWFMDDDPASNQRLQVLPNIGTESGLSIASYGDSDALFLASTGIRSLRARDSSDTAAINDIGTPIDSLVVDEIRALSDSSRGRSFGIIEPTDGRYWLWLPSGASTSNIYTFSFFQGSKVAAWSVYLAPFQPGKFVVLDDRLYVLDSTGAVYLYGGVGGATYESVDNAANRSIVTLPFLDAGKPATIKTWTGFDAAMQGTWTIGLATDTSAASAFDNCGDYTQSTFNTEHVSISGIGSHAALKFTHNANGAYARIGSAILHYMSNESK